MSFKIRLSPNLRQALAERLRQAYAMGQLRLIKRIHALLHLAAGQSIAAVAELLNLGEQTVRDYLAAFLGQGLASLVYRRAPGRSPKLTQTQRQELADLITAGPEAAGYATGCWSALLLQDLILCRFGVEYHPHYLCQRLKTLGFSFQKARFVSDHLDELARAAWLAYTFPAWRAQAEAAGGLLLFGDEASFAQWGSLGYTWARVGRQPVVKTTGRRKAYKVFGLIEYFSGRLFHQGIDGRFNGPSYVAFLATVLAQTAEPLFLIQDGAPYHRAAPVKAFFEQHRDRLHVIQLPSYSPDYNPIEFLWRATKRTATHNRYFPEFADLIGSVEAALALFAAHPDRVKALFGRYLEHLADPNTVAPTLAAEAA